MHITACAPWETSLGRPSQAYIASSFAQSASRGAQHALQNCPVLIGEYDLLCVGQASPCLRQHLLLVLIHVDGVRPGRFGLRVRVNLSRAKAARIVSCIVGVITSSGSITAEQGAKKEVRH